MGTDSFDWRAAAVQLAGRFTTDCFHPAVRLFLSRHPGESIWGVACSGGADSVCLLLLLHAHYPESRARFRVLTFDHRLRGEASAADVEFVRGLAASLGISCRAGSWQRRVGESTGGEEAAREARYRFFEEELSGGEAPALLFLGHNRDDVAETMLMRLARGSGASGLAAPRPVVGITGRPVRLRPLLSLPGSAIRKACSSLGIPFREDLSNRGDSHYRNRVRHRVLPVWREVSPSDAVAGAAASRELLEEDDQALNAWLRSLLPAPSPGGELDLSRLAGHPRALKRRALREWLAMGEPTRERFTRRGFDDILQAVEKGRPFRKSAGRESLLDYDGRVLRLTDARREPLFREGEWVLPWNAALVFPGGASVKAGPVELDAAMVQWIARGGPDPAREAFVDAVVFGNGFPTVRHWRAGDRCRPLGAPGSKKLQDLFTDRKTPVAERHALPLVLSGTDLVWVPGWPPADFGKIKITSAKAVHLTYSVPRTA